MSNILGNILVALGFDGAGFFTGMTKAEAVAKSSGKEIEGAFRGMGSAAEAAFAPFGEFGGIVGAAFNKIGSSAASALEHVTKFAGGGGLGLMAGAAAGAVAAVLAVDAAFVGIAIHATENANKMYEMSQKTGIAVETLSAFSAVGKIFGVDAESMGKALEKMNKSVFAAATAGETAKNAYTRLGIAIKDTDGAIRPTSDILLDVADKFSKMPNGVAKTALAMQIFGKAGAEMIPFLNEGKDGIKEYTEAASKMGAVLSEQAAASAHQFQKDLALVKLGVEGVENKIMTALVPSLNVVADQFVAALEEPDSAFNTLLTIIIDITKAVLTVGETVWAVFQLIGASVGSQIAVFATAGETLAKISQKLLHLDFSGAETAAKEGMAAVVAEVKSGAAQSAQIWKDYTSSVGKIWNPPPPKEEKKVKKGDNDADENQKQEEAAAKQILEITLARYKSQSAAARLYYEQGSIDAKQLLDAEITATNLSYQSHISYFEKLKKLYADDPVKLQAIAAEETKFKLEDLAKSTDTLATATKKYNEEAHKGLEQTEKSLEKDQSEQLKRISKATLDYAESLKAVATAEQNADNAKGKGDTASQVEDIQQSMEEGLTSKRAGWKQIATLDQAEYQRELTDLQDHDNDLKIEMQSAETALAAARASGNQSQVLEARAHLNAIKAATVQNQADITNLTTQFNKKLATDQKQSTAGMMQVLGKFNSQFMGAFNGMISGTQSVGQAFKKMFTGIIMDLADFVVQWLLKKAEMWIADKLLSTTARATEGPAAVASAAAIGTANAIASFALAPWPIDMGAPAFGATIGTSIMAMAPAAAAEKGGLVDGSLGQKVPIMAHGKEMILPADLSIGIQNMIKGNRFPANGTNGPGILPHLAAASNGGLHVHVDARGAHAGVSQEIHRAITQMGHQAVARSVAAVQDRAGRR